METDKEKLTLKELAGYLPWELKIFDTSQDYVFDLNEWLFRSNQPVQPYFKNHLDQILNDDSLKLALRPLSDLTKEITYNGETFVPLIELAKIAYPKNRPFSDFSIKENYVRLDKWNVQGYSFHFEKEISFDCRVDYDGKKWNHNCYVPNQLKLIEKIYEWHFDLHELIERNLAINLNDLPNE